MRTALLVTALSFSLHAADAVTGPVSGLLLIRDTGAIRPVQGFAGGAVLGAPVAAPDRIAALNAESGFAAGLADGAPVLFSTSAAGISRTIALTALTAAPQLLAAKGDYAAAYSAADHKVVLIENLRAAEPTVSTALENISVTALAVSASGRLLIATTSNEGTTLYGKARGEDASRIAQFDGPVALTFIDSDRALLADTAKDEVLALSASGERTLIASAREGISKPVGVASVTGATLVVSAGTRALHIIGTDSHIETLELPGAEPDRLERISADGAWKWNEGAPGVQYLFNAATRSIFFVPAEVQTNE